MANVIPLLDGGRDGGRASDRSIRPERDPVNGVVPGITGSLDQVVLKDRFDHDEFAGIPVVRVVSVGAVDPTTKPELGRYR